MNIPGWLRWEILKEVSQKLKVCNININLKVEFRLNLLVKQKVSNLNQQIFLDHHNIKGVRYIL